MRRITLLVLVLTLGSAPAAWPQQEGGRPGREELRRRLDERFAARVKEQLSLSDEQASRLRETHGTFGTRRRELESRERALRSALESQLRPGVAADRDSVARLTDQLVELRTSYAQTFRDEHREISRFLDPVQRAQLYMMRERLMRRVHEVRGERRGGAVQGRRRPPGAHRDSI